MQTKNYMNISFYEAGKSDGSSPVNYVLRDTDHNGGKREVAPTVLVGDPKDIIQEIDSIDRKNKYKSFSINFRSDEVPSKKIKLQIIDELMTRLCSGLKKEQYKFLAVDHGDHVHIVMPMKELLTGRALNIKPPGETTHEFLRVTQALINHKYGWGQVVEKHDTVKRSRAEIKIEAILRSKGVKLRLGNSLNDPKKSINEIKDSLKLLASDPEKSLIGRSLYREFLHDKFLTNCRKLKIQSRSELILNIGLMGFSVCRNSKNSITIDIGRGRRIRFKGEIYEENANIQKVISEDGLKEKFDYHESLRVSDKIFASRKKYFDKEFSPAMPIDVAKRQRQIGMMAKRMRKEGVLHSSFLSKGALYLNSSNNSIDILKFKSYTFNSGEVSSDRKSDIHLFAPKLRNQSSSLSESSVISRMSEIRAKIIGPPSISASQNLNKSSAPASNSGSANNSASSVVGFKETIGSLRMQLADLQAKMATANTFEAAKIHFQIFQIKKKLEEIIAKMKKKQDENNASSYSRPKGP